MQVFHRETLVIIPIQAVTLLLFTYIVHCQSARVGHFASFLIVYWIIMHDLGICLIETAVFSVQYLVCSI